MEDTTSIPNFPAKVHTTAEEQIYPPPTQHTRDSRVYPPFPPPSQIDYPKTTLLYNITTKTLSYITILELYKLSAIQNVNYTYIPMWTRKVNIHTGARGLGTCGYKLVGSVWLPALVVVWRVFGWFDVLWLVEGEENEGRGEVGVVVERRGTRPSLS